MLRILMAFIYAALWFPSTIYILNEFVYKLDESIDAFLIALSITGSAVLISMPIFYLIQRHRPIRFLDCLLAGISIPSLVLLGYSTYNNLHIASSSAPLCLGVGLISSTVFWIVGIRGKTNSDFYR